MLLISNNFTIIQEFPTFYKKQNILFRQCIKEQKEIYSSEIEKQKEGFKQEINSLKSELCKMKEILKNEIEKQKNIINDEIKYNNNEAVKQKDNFQHEINLMTNELDKNKEVFMQDIKNMKSQLNESIQNLNNEKYIKIIKATINPKYFENFDDELKTFIIEEILLDLSISNKNSSNYQGLVRRVFLLNIFLDSSNYILNKDERINFIKQNIYQDNLDSNELEYLSMPYKRYNLFQYTKNLITVLFQIPPLVTYIVIH